MPTHEINITIPSKIVMNKDVEFEIYSDGARLGVLKISKGSIDWLPVNHQYGFHCGWERFDEFMRSSGKQ